MTQELCPEAVSEDSMGHQQALSSGPGVDGDLTLALTVICLVFTVFYEMGN